MPFALDGWYEIPLLLLFGTTEQDVVGAAAELKADQRAAELHTDQRIHHRAQIRAAVLLGRLESPQPGGPGVGLQLSHGSLVGEALAANLGLLYLIEQRSNLLAHEFAHGLEDHPLFFAQSKVHGH